jgi:hypothetical protein
VNLPPNRMLRELLAIGAVTCPNVVPVAALKPVFGLPQRTEFVTL